MRYGRGYNGSDVLLSSGIDGNYEVIATRPDNFYRSYNRFEFISKVETEVQVKINNDNLMTLPTGYFATEYGDVVVVLTDETKDDGRSMYVYSSDYGMWRNLSLLI